MDWMVFNSFFIDHCGSNGMSVMALDRANCRLVGVQTVKTLAAKSTDYTKYYSQDETLPLAPFYAFLDKRDSEAARKAPMIRSQVHQGVNFCSLGVDPDYRGRKIANHLLTAALSTVDTSRYSFATIGSFNAFTQKAAESNGFKLVHSIDTKDFLWKGRPLYSSVKGSHGKIGYLMKYLRYVKL